MATTRLLAAGLPLLALVSTGACRRDGGVPPPAASSPLATPTTGARAAAEPPPPAERGKLISLIFTSNLHGEYEPCG